MSSSRTVQHRSNAARIFGYDIFISFALGPPPRGMHSYASDLARRLRERDFTVFFSEDEAPPGERLDATLRGALHRSKVLVVISNRGTLESPRWVRVEVEEFRRRNPNRPIIPVNIGGALQDPELSEVAQEWLQFRDKIWLDESEEAAVSGIASEALVERLATAPARAKSNVGWRWVVRAVIAALALLAIGLGVTAWIADAQRDEAVATQLLVQARNTPDSQLDVAFLLNAEALRRYPVRMDARLQALQRLTDVAHLRAVLRLDFGIARWATSADGRLAAIGGDGGEVVIVNLATWRILSRSKAHNAEVRQLAFSSDNSLLVTATDAAWSAWRLADDGLRGEIRTKAPAGFHLLFSMIVSPDNRHVAVSAWTGVWLWPIAGAENERTLSSSPPNASAPVGAVRISDIRADCVAFLPDGSGITITGDSGAEIRSMNGARIADAPVPEGIVLARNRDCSRAALLQEEASGRYSAAIRATMTGTVQSVLAGDFASRRVLASFSPNTEALVTLAPDSLSMWSTTDGRELWRTRTAPPVPMLPRFSQKGEWVAIAVEGKRVNVFDALTGSLRLDEAHGQQTDDVLFGAGGEAVLALSAVEADRSSPLRRVWLLGRGDRLMMDGVPYEARSVDLSGHPGVAIMRSKASEMLDLWDVQGRQHLFSEARGHALGKTGALAVETNADQPFLLFDGVADKGGPIARLKPTSGAWPVSGATRADGRYAVGMSDGTLHLLEQRHAAAEVVPPIVKSTITAVAISPDGRYIGIGTRDGHVGIVDARDTRESKMLYQHTGPVRSVKFSSDGRLIASGGEDRVVLLQEVGTTGTPTRLEPHERAVEQIDFLDGDRMLVSGPVAGAREVWDVRRRYRVARLGADSSMLQAVQLNPSGHDAALHFRDSTVAMRRWDASSLARDICSAAGRNLTCDEWRRYFLGQRYQKTCADAPAPRCDSPGS